MLDFTPGLKLYTTDVALIPEVRNAIGEDVGFVELYVVPNSYDLSIHYWKDCDVPYVIHAPHSMHGVNLAQFDKRNTNIKYINETQKYADELSSDTIIVHGGHNGSLTEAIYQIDRFGDDRMLLENKPKVGLQNAECIGWSPSDISEALTRLSGFVLDFVHAACAACADGRDVMEYIEEFISLGPKLYHLSDGDASSKKDKHLNLGRGNLDIAAMVSRIPQNSYVTIETPRSKGSGLLEYRNDVRYLRSL